MTEPSSTTVPGTIEFVDSPGSLDAGLARITGDIVGVDVERADSQRYFRRAALIQVGDADVCLLVDPLAIPDLSPLAEFLRDRTTVLHAIENDLEPLSAAGVDLEDVADTGVAAAVLGRPIGLGPLLEEVLGVVLTPDKERYQRADWEQRPLTDGMAEYAAGDVFYLPALWESLETELHKRGRWEWYEQELQATIERAAEDRRDWTRTKGAGRLTGEQRAIVRTLWQRRESIAREHDIAPNRLLRDATIIDVAASPASTPDELVRRNQRRRGPLKDHADDLFEAQQDGKGSDPEPRERSGRRWGDEDKTAYDEMRRVRAEIAEDLGIEAGVLCSSRPLWDAVTGQPEDADELLDLAGLRPWQGEILRDALWNAYVSHRNGSGADTTDSSEGE